MSDFTVGWVACAVYNAFLPEARRFFTNRGVTGYRNGVYAYAWPVSVPVAVFILASRRLILGKGAE